MLLINDYPKISEQLGEHQFHLDEGKIFSEAFPGAFPKRLEAHRVDL